MKKRKSGPVFRIDNRFNRFLIIKERVIMVEWSHLLAFQARYFLLIITAVIIKDNQMCAYSSAY
jgi:hypothetical protein